MKSSIHYLIVLSIDIDIDNINTSETLKNCPERDLNPRPRLSRTDVLSTTPPRQPRKCAAEFMALWLTGLPRQFFRVHSSHWKVLTPFYNYIHSN